ncbi:alpha/beta hydrolase [Clostridium hydrogenum]|uniref:alpha/beta hydrolase n=1 Tax=Clostridium hydrogenum TaxID=2855764 RepID=UPI001F313B65|nr:alpha/beta hydrolase [Clostridium hydrogenum]
MKFKTTGNPNGHKILLIHAMFVTPGIFMTLTEYLKVDYFIIMPTLDGHDVDENSIFLSVEDEADKILAYLKDSNIKELDFILGTSLGAIIAFEIYKRNEILINKVYLEGGPFFKFGPLLKKIAAKKFCNICSNIRQNPENAIEKLDNIFPGLGNQMIEVCRHITEENVKNLAYACYSFTLPKLDITAQKSVVFLYGTKEPARLCIFRLKKYKYSRIIKKNGFKHCGYLLSCPKEYAEMLKGKQY